METSLHRALKELHGPDTGGRTEVSIQGYRIDAVDGCGTLVEIQSGALGPLRGKLRKLLPDYTIRVVKPIGIRRRVVRRNRIDLADLSSRFSPKRAELFDVFEDLMGIVKVFPHPNLTIDILAATIDEVRVPRRRFPGYKVKDRRLGKIEGLTPLIVADDLWKLLPDAWDWREPFTTHDLARRLGRHLHIAQRIAYCLRCTGAALQVGKSRNSLVYARADTRGTVDVVDPACVATV